jgi:hypothetical protein
MLSVHCFKFILVILNPSFQRRKVVFRLSVRVQFKFVRHLVVLVLEDRLHRSYN